MSDLPELVSQHDLMTLPMEGDAGSCDNLRPRGWSRGPRRCGGRPASVYLRAYSPEVLTVHARCSTCDPESSFGKYSPREFEVLLVMRA